LSGYTFDSNIIIDAQIGIDLAFHEIERALTEAGEVWVSRMVWVEVLSKGNSEMIRGAREFLSRFETDEIDEDIAFRAATLRRDRSGLRSPDAIILATAQLRGRTLVTRNTRDFPPNMPGIRMPYLLPKAIN
jgi:predicted nucleic acid-binding protein